MLSVVMDWLGLLYWLADFEDMIELWWWGAEIDGWELYVIYIHALVMINSFVLTAEGCTAYSYGPLYNWPQRVDVGLNLWNHQQATRFLSNLASANHRSEWSNEGKRRRGKEEQKRSTRAAQSSSQCDNCIMGHHISHHLELIYVVIGSASWDWQIWGRSRSTNPHEAP